MPTPIPQPTPTAADTAWSTEARFGLFVSWGLYALSARHEWVMQREQTTDADYRRYVDRFAPDLYDPAAWAKDARAAGTRYAVITTKHHEGFCLRDSALTDFKAPNTPPTAISSAPSSRPAAPKASASASPTPDRPALPPRPGRRPPTPNAPTP